MEWFDREKFSPDEHNNIGPYKEKFNKASSILQKNGYNKYFLFCIGNFDYTFICDNLGKHIIVKVVMVDNGKDLEGKVEEIKLMQDPLDLRKYTCLQGHKQEIQQTIESINKCMNFVNPTVKMFSKEDRSAIIEIGLKKLTTKEIKIKSKTKEAKKFLEKNGYSVMTFLNKGGFNFVFKCKNPRGEIIAAKVVVADDLKNLNREVKTNKRFQLMKKLDMEKYERVEKSIKLFKQREELYDKYINVPEVKLVSQEEKKAIIEVPLMKGDVYNEFKNLHRKDGAPIDYKEFKKISESVLKALKVFHDKGEVHFDIKPQNILVYQAQDKTRMYQIADFGLAGNADDYNRRKFRNISYTKQKGLDAMKYDNPELDNDHRKKRGTRAYMAPEMFGKDKLDDELAKRVDIYSLGITIFQLYIMERLYPHKVKMSEVKRIFKELQESNEFKPISKNDNTELLFLDFVKYLTVCEPQNRPTVDQALEHPFIQYFCED